MSPDLTIVKSVRELPIPQGKRALYILDLDRTLINEQGQLIDPYTPQWLVVVLQDHDVIICTYRNIDTWLSVHNTLQKAGIDVIMGQVIGRDYIQFPTWGIYQNILYTNDKGSVQKWISLFPEGMWSEIYFIDDQPRALTEVNRVNPEIRLFLIY